jgi:hypothetical protein
MKKRLLAFIVASLFMIFPAIVSGVHYSDGNLLQEVCNEAIKLFDSRDEADVFSAGNCFGYIRAANDMYEIMVNNSARTICVPSGISGKQLIRIVDKFLKEHPEKLHNVASLLVYEAFQESFPCTERQPEK